MIRHGKDIHQDETISCDVVVIGTGCGGSALAARLVAKGRDVVMLEKGGHYEKEDFDQRELHMLAKIDGGRGLDTSHDLSVLLTYGNNVGGASVHYWADSYRTPKDRLQLWESRYGITGHDDQTLAPHFAKIEKDLNVHLPGPEYTNRMNELLHLGASRLGWNVQRVPQARKGCVRSGYCMQGCSYDAKQSQLVTYVRDVVAGGGRIFADCKAERILFDGRRALGVLASVLDRATGLPTGAILRVNARQVVVAAGGYGTPEFLLRQGLKDKLPALGEHIFCNPSPQSHALFAEDIIQWRNIPAAWGVEEFRLARHKKGVYQEGGYLLMANQLHPASLSAMLPLTGAAMREWMGQLPKLGGLIAWIDDAEDGRMWLDGERRLLHVPLGGKNEVRIRDAWKKQAACLFAAGALKVRFGDARNTEIVRASDIYAAVEGLDLRPARNVFAAPHPGGGARMGIDAKTSVVGSDHRIHGLDNVFVADPSVFPTAPSVDPSLTIMAFSYVAADVVDALVP